MRKLNEQGQVLCECGKCGLPAPIAKGTDTRLGHVKGQPVRFIHNHHGRLRCRQDLRADLYSWVDLNGPIIRPELGPCWIWLGHRNKKGYGQISVNGRTRLAHHVALELEGYYRILAPFGKQQVGHLCDNTSCVRPSHLKIWTPQDDADHKVSKDRQVRGERHTSAKLRQQDVDEIRRLYAAGGISKRGLARRFDVSQRTIQFIIRGEIWRHVA